MLITTGLSFLRNWKLVFSLLGVSTMLYFREQPIFHHTIRGFNPLTTAIVSPQKTPSQLSGLVKHLWYHDCTMDLQALCYHPFFPKFPDEVGLISGFNISGPMKLKPFFQRVFGYVRPPTSGRYTFAISSEDSSELWLNTERNWEKSKRIAFTGGNFTLARINVKNKSLKLSRVQISVDLNLVSGKKYYIEVVNWRRHQHTRVNNVQVLWKTPGSLLFQVINKTCTVPIQYEPLEKPVESTLDVIPPCGACRQFRSRSKYFEENRGKYKVISLIDTDGEKNCWYRPSYLARGPVKKNDGIYKKFRMTMAYPHHRFEGREALDIPRPQQPLSRNEAEDIVALFMGLVERKFPNKYLMRKIKRIEKKSDEGRNIDRFMIELQLLDKETNNTFYLSEYVLVDRNRRICSPSNYQWNKTATVYFVVTAANQTNWLIHFIRNTRRIYQETHDTNIGVVIAVYETMEKDLRQIQVELEDSGLPRYKLITLRGRYSRSQSFNAAIQAITDPHSIVFLVDLHLDIASAFVDEIRKHCIEGKSVYTPTIFRLDCGYVATNPAGYWETTGFGLVAIYKSDWDRIGGFDLHDDDSLYKWGGEDWALIDKIVGGGLEYERVRCPYVYHYYHSKEGMWSAGKD